jgi:hypothetical protein
VSVESLPSLSALYQEDETAWLEIMARLVAERRLEELDYANLSEFLADMARRDRREVYSRLVVLLTHILKWEYQPEMRSGSWRGTLMSQRRELRLLLESGTLRNHAAAVLADAYQEAREQAAAETGLPLEPFPAECAASVEELIAREEGGAGADS